MLKVSTSKEVGLFSGMVLDMTRENTLVHSDDGWKITPEVRRLAVEAGKKIKEAQLSIEKASPLCPTHKMPGKFLRLTGSYTIVKGLFECPEGDTFFY